jgi:hypothetical protein
MPKTCYVRNRLQELFILGIRIARNMQEGQSTDVGICGNGARRLQVWPEESPTFRKLRQVSSWNLH